MADSVSNFFDARAIQSADERRQVLVTAATDDIEYDDPRTPETVTGINALNDYTGMFTANAPGWSARVIGSGVTAGIARATVAFGGPGPDGKEVTQIGQHFVEMKGDLISRMVGFVGTGPAE